ncbi:MAG: rhomboid family intramembrane serine protease [Burkholderiales bacterium]
MMNRLTPVVQKLLLINIILFLAYKFLGFDLVKLLGLRYPLSDHFRPYQFLTHLFMHASFFHLLSNMFSLITFGPILEYTLSSKRFLIFYIFTGIGAALLYLLVGYIQLGKFTSLYHTYLTNPTPEGFTHFLNQFPEHVYSKFYDFARHFFDHPHDPHYINQGQTIMKQLYLLKTDVPTVGASGAIFATLTAFAMLFPDRPISIFLLPISIQARYFIVLYGLYELYAGIQTNPADQVAHFAHLGGILFAYFFIKIWKGRQG